MQARTVAVDLYTTRWGESASSLPRKGALCPLPLWVYFPTVTLPSWRALRHRSNELTSTSWFAVRTHIRHNALLRSARRV